MSVLLQKDIYMAASGHGFMNAETCSSKVNVTFSGTRENAPSSSAVDKCSRVTSNSSSNSNSSSSVLVRTEAKSCAVRSCLADGLPPCIRNQDAACMFSPCCAQVMGVCRQATNDGLASTSSSDVFQQLESLRLTEIQTITAHQLADRIAESPDSFVLLDCRPFIAYNMVHVTGALSLNCCDRLTRKRLLCGKIRLEDVISGLANKEEYKKKKKSNCDIIVYDEESSQLDRTGPPSPLKLVVNLLKKEEHNVYYVKGGLSSIQKEFPSLCVKPEYTQPPLLYSPTTPDVVNDEIDTAVITEVLPFLYIGNYRDAANLDCLKQHGITHVLNITAHVPFHFEAEGIVYKRLPATDSGHQNLKQYFEDAFRFIEEARSSRGKVLIHCQAGVSRSATIAISYIMKNSTLTMLQAFKFVKSKRSIIAPNLNFMGQLYELEQLLNEGKISRKKDTVIPNDLLSQ